MNIAAFFLSVALLAGGMVVGCLFVAFLENVDGNERIARTMTRWMFASLLVCCFSCVGALLSI